MADRKHERRTKRLETTFTSSGQKYTGISSDLSQGGLFIRTQHGFLPGSVLGIELHLPDGTISRNKGIVRRTTKVPSTLSSIAKNGMGVLLIETDTNYRAFLQSIGVIPGDPNQPENSSKAGRNAMTQDESAQESESLIIACAFCNAKNRVPKDRLFLGPKCGKCGATLVIKNAP